MRNIKKLSVIWDKRQKDFVVKYPRSCDGALAMNHLLAEILLHDIDKPFEVFNFKDELEKRGYDLKTLRFSVELK